MAVDKPRGRGGKHGVRGTKWGKGHGDIWPRLPIPHYHHVLRPKGTSHNDASMFDMFCILCFPYPASVPASSDMRAACWCFVSLAYLWHRWQVAFAVEGVRFPSQFPSHIFLLNFPWGYLFPPQADLLEPQSGAHDISFNVPLFLQVLLLCDLPLLYFLSRISLGLLQSLLRPYLTSMTGTQGRLQYFS